MASKRRQQQSRQQTSTIDGKNTKEKTPLTREPARGPGRLLVLALSLLVSLVFYGNTLQNGYSLDDELVTQGQRNVERGFAGIPAIFTSHYSVNEKQNFEYRPVVLTSFAIEYQLFGRNPAVSHFVNLLLYALLGYLIYYTMGRLFPQQHWSFAALVTFIFMIHPVHSEVVASLKNRDELMAFILALLSLNAFIRYAEKGKLSSVLLALLYFMLAMMSKKSVLPFVFLVPFTLLYVKKAAAGRTIVLSLLGTLGGILLMVLLKKMLLSPTDELERDMLFFENPLYAGGYGTGQVLMMAIASFGFYVKMALVPYPLVSYYGYNTFDGFHFGVYHVWGLAGMLLLGFVVYRYWFRSKPMVWGAMLFIASISMFVNLVSPAVGIVAERFLFQASLGGSVLLAGAVLMLLRSFRQDADPVQFRLPAGIKWIAAGLAVTSALVVIPRNTEWRNHVSLYHADIQKVPQSAKLNSLLGTVYAQRLGTLSVRNEQFNRYADSALYFFRHALAVYPDYISANNNLGTIYINFRDNLDSSAKYFKHALALDSGYAEAMANYAVTKETQAEIANEKLAWAKTLVRADAPAPTAVFYSRLHQHDALFKALLRMKKELQQQFIAAVTAGSPEQAARARSGFEAIISAGARFVTGGKPQSLDLTGFMKDLMQSYTTLRDSARYDLLGEVTDSVVSRYFYPAIKPAGLDAQVSPPVVEALAREVAHDRNESVEYYLKAIKKRPLNAALFNKIREAFNRWKRYDDMMTALQYVQADKGAKQHMVEMYMAQTCFSRQDYAGGYAHALKMIEATEKIQQRIKTCTVQFAAAGNNFGVSYFTEAQKVSSNAIRGFAARYIPLLRKQNMDREAGDLEQRIQKTIAA